MPTFSFTVLFVCSAALYGLVGCIQKKAEVFPAAAQWHIVEDQGTELPEVAPAAPAVPAAPESEKGKYSGFQIISVASASTDVDVSSEGDSRDRVFYHTRNHKNLALDRLFPSTTSYDNNKKVQYYLKFFQQKNQRYFARWLERSQYYMPQIRRILQQEGIPEILAYLPLIESGFNPNAVSRKHAVGLWQFIRSTGKIFDLKVNFWVDERRDYEKATVAAARYLKKLHNEFDSWELALAAYNCGERRVRKGIKKTRSNDFWVVSRTLPRETRNYVPKFIASLMIVTNLEKHGFKQVVYGEDMQLVKVSVPPERNLRDIAKAAGYSTKKIVSHNPFLINKVTPPGKHSYIYVEPAYAESFARNSQQIADLRKTNFRRSVYATYHVRKGDSLWGIARKFGVGVKSIKETNKLKSDLLRPGQKLTIGNSIYATYHVRKGDNLWGIARKFGVGVNSIKKANALETDFLKPGQKLTIRRLPTPVYEPSRGDHFLYVVKQGDTIGEIAEQHGVRTSHLKRYNGLNSSMIRVRQVLKIPSGGGNSFSYNIKYGDTLSEIAVKYRVSVNDIKKWNGLRTSKLTAGKNLKIYR